MNVCASATTPARESHASHTPYEHRHWCSHGVREACDVRAVVVANGLFYRISVHGFKIRAQ
eukprot:10561320-Lingulodinium_polyedra.AAC.1